MSRQPSLLEMVRARPARALLLSVTPLLLAVTQLVNVVFYDLAASYGMAFAAAMVVVSAGVTRQQLATFHTRQIESAFRE